MQPILTIDLTTKNIETTQVPVAWERDYLGAASLAARFLYEHLLPDLDPLSPQAPLVFMTGPLTGTGGPAVGRFVVCARSPATGLWGESNCGGFWGPELRKAGYAGLWITGKAEGPVYLWIQDGRVEIRDADSLWGLGTDQAQVAILGAIGVPRTRVAVIGPAGEAGVPMATIQTDHGRMAGRTGMGAVMGSKNLKAIAVKGSAIIPFATQEYAGLRRDANRELKDDNITHTMQELGTASGADYMDYLGEMPKKYFQAGTFDGVYNVSGASMAETILVGTKACHGCLIACGREVQLPQADRPQKGPEYETIVGFGPNLLIDDLVFITRMGERCDRFGVDTISLSNAMGLAFSLFEQGVITKQDTGGLALNWGDQGVVELLLDQACNLEGFGASLLKGARALGKDYKAEEQAVEVHGLEVAYHDPRGASGMALCYATSPRGACHNQSDYFMSDLYGLTETELGMAFFNRHARAEKAANVAIHQNWRTVFNSLVMCTFANVPPTTVLALVNAATGLDYSLAALLSVGERAWNLKRIINQRLGLRQEEDRLPLALRTPYAEGGAAGYQVPFEEMLAAYYRARGWDPGTGMPTVELLAKLDLEWIEKVEEVNFERYLEFDRTD